MGPVIPCREVVPISEVKNTRRISMVLILGVLCREVLSEVPLYPVVYSFVAELSLWLSPSVLHELILVCSFVRLICSSTLSSCCVR